MSNWKEKIKALDSEDLAEVLAAANREAKKRLKEKIPVSQLSNLDFNEWASSEIAKAEAEKAKAKETE